MDSSALIVKTEFYPKAFRNDFQTEANAASDDPEVRKLPPVYKTEPMLRFTRSDGTVWARRAYPPDFRLYAKEYETFVKGGITLDGGTPLEDLKGLTLAEIGVLREMRIGYVEVLAQMPEGQAAEMGPRYQQLRLYAQDHLRVRQDMEEVFRLRGELEKKDLEIKRLTLGSMPAAQIVSAETVEIKRQRPEVEVVGQENTDSPIFVETKRGKK